MSSLHHSDDTNEIASTEGWPYRSALIASLSVALISLAIYWSTCFRTITWWDNSEYSLAAVTLGIPHPPGSLLSTLLGWIVTQLPLGDTKIFKLNLFAGLLAAITSMLVCRISISLIKKQDSSETVLPAKTSTWLTIGVVAIVTLVLAFGETLWLYATKFTPYVLTALFTAMILWALFKWWEHAEKPDAFKWLFLAALLLGLDFSVHRTNLLLLPGMFFWVVLRNPKTFVSSKSWRYGILGLAVGLGMHLLIIPLAARAPFMNFNDPSSWSRFWSYITLQQYGGGWLINLFPRKAPFWQVQVIDYLRIFGANFASLAGKTGILGLLPVFFGLTGLVFLWRRNWRLAAGVTVLFLLTSIGAVFYFNTPANYFRSMDRHYLPSLLIFTLWIGYGAGSMSLLAWHSLKRYRPLPVCLIGLLVIATPVQQLIRNFNALSSSRSFFAHDFAANALSNLPANAILFTGGDNDTYPLWYLQIAEGVRPDVTILNINLMNTSWYVDQAITRDPSLPLGLTKDELTQLAPRAWHDTTIAVAVQGSAEVYQLPHNQVLPDSLYLQVPPTVADKYLLIQDWLILQMISRNQWNRPICFMATMSPTSISYLSPYLRLEGMAQRLVPVASPPLNKELLRRSFLEQYVYHGYADPSIPLDQVSLMMGWNYYAGLTLLASAEHEGGNDSACAAIVKKMLELLPLDRLHPPAPLREGIEALCESASSSGF